MWQYYSLFIKNIANFLIFENIHHIWTKNNKKEYYVAIFFFFRKIIANLFNRKTFARFGPENIKKGILCGNFLLLSEKYRQFYFQNLKSIRHI